MPGRGPRARFWCFTLNNYTQENLDRLSSPLDGVDYIIYGKEVGESGTRHLQGTVCFQSRRRLSQVIASIGQAHCSVTRSLSQSIEYCKKDGAWEEFGSVPREGTSRRESRRESDADKLEEFKVAVKDGTLALKELREQHSAVCARYPRFVREYLGDNKPVVEVRYRPQGRRTGVRINLNIFSFCSGRDTPVARMAS